MTLPWCLTYLRCYRKQNSLDVNPNGKLEFFYFLNLIIGSHTASGHASCCSLYIHIYMRVEMDVWWFYLLLVNCKSFIELEPSHFSLCMSSIFLNMQLHLSFCLYHLVSSPFLNDKMRQNEIYQLVVCSMGRFYWLCCCTNCFQLFLRKFNIFALKKYHGSIITHSNESLIASQIQFNGKEKYFPHIVRFSLKTFIARSAVLKSIEKILLCILN